jgi:hypothetical protein
MESPREKNAKLSPHQLSPHLVLQLRIGLEKNSSQWPEKVKDF